MPTGKKSAGAKAPVAASPPRLSSLCYQQTPYTYGIFKYVVVRASFTGAGLPKLIESLA